jgi:hypothetical protein
LLKQTAGKLNLSFIQLIDLTDHEFIKPSQYVVLMRNPGFSAGTDLEANNQPVLNNTSGSVWTDDYSSLVNYFKL